MNVDKATIRFKDYFIGDIIYNNRSKIEWEITNIDYLYDEPTKFHMYYFELKKVGTNDTKTIDEFEFKTKYSKK